MSLRVLAIIPSFNEEKALPALAAEFQSLPYELLIVDDGSKDKTFEVASRLGTAVRLPINLGIGGAVQTGIRFAHAKNFDFCVQVDGDGQHIPGEIRKLIQTQQETGAELVIGSRFMEEESFKSTLLRRLGINLLRKTLRIFYRREIRDPTSGFRLMNRTAIEFFHENYPQDFPEPISIGMALNRKFVVAEVAVKMREREHGTSSIKGLKTLSYMLRVVSYLIILRVGRKL